MNLPDLRITFMIGNISLGHFYSLGWAWLTSTIRGKNATPPIKNWPLRFKTLILLPTTSEGNIFRSLCQSFCSWVGGCTPDTGGVDLRWQMYTWAKVHIRGRGCTPEAGCVHTRGKGYTRGIHGVYTRCERGVYTRDTPPKTRGI